MYRRLICTLLICAMMILTAMPALADTLYGVVTTPTSDGAAYVRRVAGVGQPIVGSAKNGDQLVILKKGNTWHKVQVVRTGVTGWMYGRYISFSTTATDINQPGVVASNAGYANFRTGAGTNSTIIAQLNNGSSLNVISKTGNWYYVYYAATNTYGYISANLVSLKAASGAAATGSAEVFSNDGYANLRKGAGTNYGVVTKLYNGTAVEIVSASGNWSRVNVPSTNQYGYVYTSLLSTSDASSDTDWTNGWVNSWTNADAYTTGKIASSDGYANFRTGAGTSHSVIAKLYNDVLVSILDSEGNWYKVQLSDAGQTGYVHKSLVEEVDSLGTKTATNNVNMRTGPGINYDKKTVITKGTPVSILSTSGSFAHVNAQGWIGYVSLNYLK